MNRKVISFLKSYTYSETNINRILVSAFLYTNQIKNINNKFICSFLISDEDEEFIMLQDFIKFYDSPLSIEELLTIFEFVISPEDKEVNGAVFTPLHIRDFIVREALSKYISDNYPLSILKIGDIACGCGGFFLTISEQLFKLTSKNFHEIYSQQIYGLDIQEYSVIRTKILLILFAILNGEDNVEFEFNLFCGNALGFDWKNVGEIENSGGFDIIVGNPPYVGSSKIDVETKRLLKNWSVTSSGKADLYIPFFEIGLENLKKGGVLGYITVNTFYKSLNGRSIRSYLSKNRFDFSLIDFGGEQLFRGRSTYTCICLITKIESNYIHYIKAFSSEISSIKKSDFINISYSELNDFDGWFLIDKKVRENIEKIEKIGSSLGTRFEIRNGFATLKNNIYVFTPVKEDQSYYFLQKDGNEYKIEKDICRNAIKPNTLKSASGIEAHMEKLIFPYVVEGYNDLFKEEKRNLKIMEEDYLKSKFPFTYEYLSDFKNVLSLRDNGNREYDAWYAYGRNQALLISGYKLLLPYITAQPCFVYTADQELLFYNGYAIIAKSESELLILQKILMSDVFWYYIKNTSKPYSGDYFSVAKNYIKNFGICELDESEKNRILQFSDSKKLNKFLADKYEIDII